MKIQAIPTQTFRKSHAILYPMALRNAPFDDLIRSAGALGAPQSRIDQILDTYYFLCYLTGKDVLCRASLGIQLRSMAARELFRAEPYPHMMHMRKEN